MAANLEAVDIRKVYPGTVALKGVSLAFQPGEVHALIGKNGAGKSTFVQIISGAAQPTSGRLFVRGEETRLRTPREAHERGIATVYQELSLVPELSIAHNIFLAELPTKWGGLRIDWAEIYQRAQAVVDDLGLHFDVRQPVRTLGVANQQMVEIAKAMAAQPKVLLLDEPTSSLAEHETEQLFRLVRALVSRGVSIVYISHRLQELQRIAHRVSVLRDGELVGTIPIAEADPATIAQMMFGQVVPKHRPENLPVHEETVLEARNISRRGRLHGVSFKLQKGEVLGIAGLVGAGRTDLLRVLAGADAAHGGEIVVGGTVVHRPTVQRMKNLGIGLTPESRKEEGLVLTLSTRENACMASLRRHAHYGVISGSAQRAVVEGNVRDLQIAVGNIETPVATLSGGNQQKVVIAKWLNTHPRVLLFDEPTRGIDIQAKQQIFQVIWDLSRQGISTVFVSSELEELLEVCHRILVMQHGHITSEVQSDEVTLQELFALCVTEANEAAAAS